MRPEYVQELTRFGEVEQIQPLVESKLTDEHGLVILD